MTPAARHERYQVDGADILFADTWADDDTPGGSRPPACNACGMRLPEDAVVCEACGTPVDECSGSCASCGAQVCARRLRPR
ncbi:MAG: hypothetical protein FDZ70_05955 [Actinobacteria bacterium]|nr:MAG: hypothetical protein FDZ70_05955 [Actinomycetota bacterium]